MKRISFYTFILISLFFIVLYILNTNENKEFNPNLPIKKYFSYKSVIKHNNQDKIITRIFYQEKHIYALATSLETLKSEIILIDESVQFKPKDINSIFDKLLQKYATYTKSANNGIISSEKYTKNIFLTIDLCPSTKTGFEKNFFESLINKNKSQKPTPISISISGRWIENHLEDFLWLVKQKDENKLDITWINHTFNHWYDRTKEDNMNFLNLKNTNLDYEIFELEKLLLRYNQVPSVFIRFPGLIANEDTVEAMKNKYYLIPVGTNAWVAKQQIIKGGSIVLVHGNLNEHNALSRAEELIKDFELSPIQELFE